MDATPLPLDQDAAQAEAEKVLEIEADIAASFTYASYQNSVPVLRAIRIINPTDRSIEGAELSLSSSPSFLRSKTWRIDRILSGDEISPADRKIELDADYLAGLNEAERGEITLSLTRGDEVLAEARFPVRLLARDEWGGVADMAQLLPAFVMPNDGAVAKVLRAAGDALARHGHPSALDGYQSGDPRRAWMLTAAIYSAVAGLSLHYAEPPASFESRGQKVRLPATILNDGLATCLDTSLLFVAALEAAGLNSVVLLFEGHAAAGVWLTKRTLPRTVEQDVVELRKALVAGELVAFETTAVTHRPPVTFDQACQLARTRLDETNEASFVAAVDIARSRSSGITPLASHAPPRLDEALADDAIFELPLPPMPDLGDLPGEIVEVKPTTPASRIDRWQRKLLDLSLRNRLLNFTASKATVPFICTDPAALEDRLADGAKIRVISIPEQNPLGERDATLYRETRGEDIHRQFAADAQQRDELASPLDRHNLEGRLITLYREANRDLAEGGTNTLYLAVGFLRWKKKPEDERSYRAPLLLVPVKLERRSASSEFRLAHHEDEVRFNATLLQFLDRDFDLRIPLLESELPVDDSGVDVTAVMERMRTAVRDVAGFEVVDETALGTFSFAKYLMWKDLTERTDALRQNRVVKHLIDTPEQPFTTNSAVFRAERDIDRSYSPADIVTPLPADSSQMVASLAAAEGTDFVIVGPPGTGKSQTIANMIANCLAKGKTVLFVAEKTAALNVVYRRLREHGLDNHCLELHSNKADRRHFVGQLRNAWENGRDGGQSEWIELNGRLKVRRDELNGYVDALHRQAANGLTPFAAMGIALRDRRSHAPALSWPSRAAHDRQTFLDLEELAAELGRTFSAVESRPVLNLINVTEWSSAWQERLLAAARGYREAVEALRHALGQLRAELELSPDDDCALATLSCYADFARHLKGSEGDDYSIVLKKDFGAMRSSLIPLEQAVEVYSAGERSLAGAFDRTELARIPVDDLDRQWREASASTWPLSWMRSRSCQKLLQSYARSGKTAPQNDLPLIRKMQEAAGAVAESPLAVDHAYFAGVDTDLAGLRDHLDAARQLYDSLLAFLKLVGDIEPVVRSVTPALAGSGDGATLFRAAGQFADAEARLGDAAKTFHDIAGAHADTTDEMSLSEIAARMDEIEDSRDLLRNWSAWCGVRNRAAAHGLGPLIADLQCGAVQPEAAREAFRLGYVRWWLPLAIDDDATLRSFQRFRHEHAIADFGEIDDLVRKAASHRVVAAVAHDLPASHAVPRHSELGLLRHQMELQRPSRSIREMIGAMPETFSKLAPCVLMSPLSIAQYLPADKALFDVVIFDEASQITTWDAVGAIARGRQTIIVGDPKQLPPTNFFGRNEEEGEDVEDYERDLESILDETKASGLPVHDLRWHYRSRHESLIAFSNWHYYGNRLITFPSPVTDDRAVSLRRVPNAVYDRGKSRTNKTEARAVADEVARRLKGWLSLPEEERLTIGVITFNSQQRTLIQDLLDEKRRDHPELEWFFADERIEPVLVANLENVQGDERDVILFSITFCEDLAGKLTMNFGAINNDGGERRLNVAVTRARQEMVVFSGITADRIDLERTKAIGVQHLKAFLDYAERGPVALAAEERGSQGSAESPFEEAVAAELQNRGWTLVPQVGVSGFRVDIGVKHPDRAGAYLAGVECDGATYHSSATARDRDKVREQVLRGLGWNIVRVWSTDWWFDRATAAQRLHGALDALLAASREAPPSIDEQIRWEMDETETLEPAKSAEPAGDHSETEGPASDDPEEENKAVQGGPPNLFSVPIQTGAGEGQPHTDASVYKVANLSTFPANPNAFFDFSYRQTVQAMVDAVLQAEAPVREDILMQRIARAHGWQRTGRRIRERIALHLRDVDRTVEQQGTFLWRKGTVVDRLSYRTSAEDAENRSIPEICLAELNDVVLRNPSLLNEQDPALVLARLVGIERLSATSREILEAALDRAAH